MCLIPKKNPGPILTGKLICHSCWEDMQANYIVDCGYGRENADCTVLDYVLADESWVFVYG